MHFGSLAHGRPPGENRQWPHHERHDNLPGLLVMPWKRIKGRWKLFRAAGKRARHAAKAREASDKQMAAWLAREHKSDPIHQ